MGIGDRLLKKFRLGDRGQLIYGIIKGCNGILKSRKLGWQNLFAFPSDPFRCRPPGWIVMAAAGMVIASSLWTQEFATVMAFTYT